MLFKVSVKRLLMIYRLHNKSSCIVLLLAKITPSGAAADVGLHNLCCEFESYCPCQLKRYDMIMISYLFYVIAVQFTASPCSLKNRIPHFQHTPFILRIGYSEPH